MFTLKSKRSYLLNFTASDAHFPEHPFCLSAGELAVEAETVPEGGNDHSIRECVITFPLLCLVSHIQLNVIYLYFLSAR